MSDHSEKKCRPDHKRIVTVNNSKNKTSSVKHQSDDDEEQSKTESIVSSSAGKARRTLFTANSGDWSDVTEELSENSPPTLSESTDTSQLFHRLSTQPSATQVRKCALHLPIVCNVLSSATFIRGKDGPLGKHHRSKLALGKHSGQKMVLRKHYESKAAHKKHCGRKMGLRKHRGVEWPLENIAE